MPQINVPRIILILLLILGINTTLYADEKKVEIEVFTSISNANKPSELLLIELKTNIPKETLMVMNISGTIYRSNSLKNIAVSTLRAEIDKKGYCSAKSLTVKLNVCEEYKIEVSIDSDYLRNKEKPLKKQGYNIEDLSKIRIIHSINLASPSLSMKRQKSALSIAAELRKLINLQPDIARCMQEYKSLSSNIELSNQLKRIQQTMSKENFFLDTADYIQQITKRIYLYELSLNSNPQETLVKLPTPEEMSIAYNVFSEEIGFKIHQDLLYLIKTYQESLGDNLGNMQNNITLENINQKKWVSANTNSKKLLDQIIEECAAYKTVGNFPDNSYSKKIDYFIAACSKTDTLRESLINLVKEPNNTNFLKIAKQNWRVVLEHLSAIKLVTQQK
ncbi:MAG: hypothetical protein WC980_02700 [Candidatus Brocadiia bacterium]